MTDKEIVDTMRNWFGDPDVADCVFESEQSIKDWLVRGTWFRDTCSPITDKEAYRMGYMDGAEQMICNASDIINGRKYLVCWTESEKRWNAKMDELKDAIRGFKEVM